MRRNNYRDRSRRGHGSQLRRNDYSPGYRYGQYEPYYTDDCPYRNSYGDDRIGDFRDRNYRNYPGQQHGQDHHREYDNYGRPEAHRNFRSEDFQHGEGYYGNRGPDNYRDRGEPVYRGREFGPDSRGAYYGRRDQRYYGRDDNYGDWRNRLRYRGGPQDVWPVDGYRMAYDEPWYPNRAEERPHHRAHRGNHSRVYHERY
jgi:hypothetical protein